MLTIGQMAGIFNVSTKTLRHYETTGLFCPIMIGEDNQYRYYGLEQLAELRQIIWLRSMGVGIEIIRALKLSGVLQDDEKIRSMLEEHAQNIRIEIERQQQLLNNVARMIERIHKKGGVKMEPKVVWKTSFTIVGLKWSDHQLNDGVGIPDHWNRFMSRAHEVIGRTNTNEFYGIGMPEQSGEFHYVAGFEASREHIPDGMVAITVPEQTYALISHTGSLVHIWETREIIYSTLLPKHGLIPTSGILYELYDNRFRGPHHPETQIDLYVPIES